MHRTSAGHNKGLVRLIEQVPGRTHSADLTDALLQQGYWATYGLPFFKVRKMHPRKQECLISVCVSNKRKFWRTVRTRSRTDTGII